MRLCHLLTLVFSTILLLSFSAYAFTNNQLESYAKQLPLSHSQTPEMIIQHLIKPEYSEMEKARILAYFVAYQMQKNGYAEKIVKEATEKQRPANFPSSSNILQTRIGTSFDYAELYNQLCSIAGLESVIVDGYAGKNVQAPNRNNIKLQTVKHALHQTGILPNFDMQRYESAWNAVRIKDRWILVDTYWLHKEDKATLGKDIQTDREMKRFLAKREQKQPTLNELTKGKTINNDYFDAKPRTFVKTHFPFDSQWQLLPTPITLTSFLK